MPRALLNDDGAAHANLAQGFLTITVKSALGDVERWVLLDRDEARRLRDFLVSEEI